MKAYSTSVWLKENLLYKQFHHFDYMYQGTENGKKLQNNKTIWKITVSFL